MENGPKYTFIVSTVIIVLAAILFVYGSIVGIDVESEAVFKGTEGTVQIGEYSAYTVFVNDELDCYDTDIVITDGTLDYFEQDCDKYMDEDGWKYAGTLSYEASGNLNVTSNNEILIVDDMVYLESGGSVIAGACSCCVGVIGLIVGAIWTRSSGNQPVAQIIVMPGQVEMQQPMAVQPATGVQVMPDQVQVQIQQPMAVQPTTGFQPGNLIITQQEEEPGA